MISNANRAFCAILSTLGAAGLVMFANPAKVLATSRGGSAPATMAAAMPIAAARRG